MKRKILTLLFAAATFLSLSSVSVMAQTTSEQTSEQTLVSSGQNENREFDKNTLREYPKVCVNLQTDVR